MQRLTESAWNNRLKLGVNCNGKHFNGQENEGVLGVMRKILLGLFAAFCFSPLVAIAGDNYPVPDEVKQKHTQMLYPTVLVRSGQDSGSGTIIFSNKRDDKWVSLVLTNHHVIESGIKVEEEWDSRSQKKVERETRQLVHIDLWEYNNYSNAIGTMGRQAKIVAWDKDRDLALLQVVDAERPLPYVAKLYPEKKDLGPWIYQQVFAVGAGLGKPPFPTEGLLAGFSRDSNGRAIWMGTAPIIFGNSGGSLFVYSPRNKYELIGVPSMVSAFGWGTPVTHMGWARPISEIRIFLRENNFGYVLGDVEKKKEKDKP